MAILKDLGDALVGAWDSMAEWQRYLVIAIWAACLVTILTRL